MKAQAQAYITYSPVRSFVCPESRGGERIVVSLYVNYPADVPVCDVIFEAVPLMNNFGDGRVEDLLSGAHARWSAIEEKHLEQPDHLFALNAAGLHHESWRFRQQGVMLLELESWTTIFIPCL